MEAEKEKDQANLNMRIVSPATESRTSVDWSGSEFFDTRHQPKRNYKVKILIRFPLNSYVPRKCSATNRIIKANDHASVQLSVGKVDENGRYTGENQVYALSGFVRAMGESDDSINRLTQRDGFLKGVWSASR